METYTTVTEAVEGLKRRGFVANFELIDGEFRAIDSGRSFQADELMVVEFHRFEGITNPADESIVFAIRSEDGVCGVLVDAYGVYATPEITAFLKNVRMRKAP